MKSSAGKLRPRFVLICSFSTCNEIFDWPNTLLTADKAVAIAAAYGGKKDVISVHKVVKMQKRMNRRKAE